MKQGKALKHNVGIAKWYYDEIDEMTEEMTSETQKEIKPLYKRYLLGEIGIVAILLTVLTSLQDKFYFLFKDKSEILVKKFIEKQLKYARFSVANALKPIATETTIARLMNQSLISMQNEDFVKMAIFNNVSLIRSIPEEYFKDIVGAVSRAMESGGDMQYLEKQLLNWIKLDGNKAHRRAKLIAYDQTRKVYSALSVSNMKEAGVQKVMWMHSHAGEVPRCLHIRPYPKGLNGLVFDIDKPPVIQEAKGKQPEVRGYPGELINCRCFLKPVIE